MEIQQILTLIEETGLSPEDVADRMGVSGMTIRRWQQKPATDRLASLYIEGLRKAIFELVLDGSLKADSRSAQWAFSSADPISQRAALIALGFPMDGTNLQTWDTEQLLSAIGRMGAIEPNQVYVSANAEKISTFKSLSDRWSEAIAYLQSALSSVKLRPADKFVAFGAICYLLMPFDLIPDSIPVVGLLDDFAILSLANEHYRKIFGLSV